MIKNNKDIPVGAVVTTDNGAKYIVLVDDAGQRGLFTKTGTWRRFDGDTLNINKASAIDTIQIFDTLPPLDAVSEAIKMMYTGRAACAHLATIYTAEDPAVTAAKKRMAELDAEYSKLRDFVAANVR